MAHLVTRSNLRLTCAGAGKLSAPRARTSEGAGTHLEVSMNDPLLVAVLDRRHDLGRRDATLKAIPGADAELR